MPLFMDVHRLGQAMTAEKAAGAHAKDLEIQGQYGMDYKRYWFNPADGTIFCLVEASSKEAADTVHRSSHGLAADEIIEVTEGE